MNRIRPHKAPALPQADAGATPQFINRLTNILRTYFSQVDSNIQALVGDSGGRHLTNTYGHAVSNATHTAVTPNTPAQVVLSNMVSAAATELTVGGGVAVSYEGVYRVQYSAQLASSDSSLRDATAWLRLNNADIPNSAQSLCVPESHDGEPGYVRLCGECVVQLNPTDELTIWWATTNTLVAVAPVAAVSGVHPACTAATLTLSFISALR